jgi:hypothetical protein
VAQGTPVALQVIDIDSLDKMSTSALVLELREKARLEEIK